MPRPSADPKPTENELIQEHLETAQKVRSGEYFREARSFYNFTIHDPMAERYMYLFVTAIAIVILLVAQLAVGGIYPLNRPVPLIVSTADPYEDLPHLKSLINKSGAEPSEAVLAFLAGQYVITREEYDINSFDRNVNATRSQSSSAVFNAFQDTIDPHNADSPITLYQRHSVRKIRILSAVHQPDGMQVDFQATVESATETRNSRWRANIAFEYSKLELDEKTGKIKHVKFVVTNYRVKRLQDVK